eukprot:6927680-Prymnesium_polylepis.2
MVVGFIANQPKDFGILLLAKLGMGQSISATDDGWSTAATPNAFKYAQYDSHATHVAIADEPAGTVLTMADFDNTLDLGNMADLLLVYQGTSTNPTFLCALDNSGGYVSFSSSGSVGGWH